MVDFNYIDFNYIRYSFEDKDVVVLEKDLDDCPVKW